jgi:type II secretory pathway component GspD/PulD (secretin)
MASAIERRAAARPTQNLTRPLPAALWRACAAIAFFCAAFLVTANLATAQDAASREVVADVSDETAAKAAQPQSREEAPTPAPAASVSDRRFMFNFANQPWKPVLEWYAKEAGLSLTIESPPPGTFNYNDSRLYNATEALDILNRVLYTTKGFLLVRHDKILVLVNLEASEVAPQLIPDVPLEELDTRGEFELIRVIFPVWNMTTEQAAAMVQQLLGPKMKVATLPQSRQIQVTELAGRLRTIRKVIEAGNQPGPGGFRPFELKHISVDAAMPMLRQSLGIPTGADQTTDNPPSARLTRSAVGNTVLFQGTPEAAARIEQMLNLIDRPENGIELARQTQTYPLGPVDPETARKVLEETFRGNPSVTIVVDATAGNVTVVAPTSAHATIRATLDMLQQDARQVAVFRLIKMDPLSAKTIVSSMFGGAGTAEQPNPSGVSVDYDTAQRVLIVRGNKNQLDQVRTMLAQMGETAEGAGSLSSGQRIRRLEYSQGAALSALNQIQRIMPALGNRIMVLPPSVGVSVRRPATPFDPSLFAPPARDTNATGAAPSGGNNAPTQPNAEQTPGVFQRMQAPATPPKDRETRAGETGLFRLVAQVTAEPPAPGVPPAEGAAAALSQAAQAAAAENRGKPIIIVPSANGLVVVSDDTEALDTLEELLAWVAPSASTTERQFAVFYLRYASADLVASVLGGFYGTGNAAGRGGGGRGRGGNLVEQLSGQLVEQLAGSATGAIGNLISGATGLSSTAVEVVPLMDHNAVLVRAKPSDLDMIEQIIDVIDKQSGPIEDESDPEPRRIQVNNMLAADMATFIQTIYADRIAGANAGGAMSNDQLLRLFGGNNTQQEPQKMTLAVDANNNQLIVRAPDVLFEKVKRMVEELDASADASTQVTQLVPLSGTALLTVRGALEPMSTSAQQQQQQTANNNLGGQGQRGGRGQAGGQNALQQQLQTLQQFQQAINRGRGGQRGGGGVGGAGGGRGAGGRGGRGGRGGGG